MNIVVCIKQVPEIALVRFDESGQLVIPDAPGTMNPFDEYAVEEGLRLKEKHGGTITVMGCGDQRAASGLRDAIALGAERGVHLLDPAFTGSDGIAIAAILAAGIRKLGGIDLCLFGKNAVDTDRSVVPGATAGKLGWPQALFAKKIESIENGIATVLRITEDGYDRVTVPLPAVLSVVKEINEPRLPSLKGKLKAKSAPLDVWSASDLGIDPNRVGVHSATHVHAVHAPPPRQKCERLEGEPAQVAATLFQRLRDAKVI
ncbi:MAG: electron transfer flavoprotein subunit beta/FixA family protein [candidate division Zixibacteria bacterium]|nr:electron transfer flavoprotein subunit beta/FixA family protein [candidate division Zixibacteria bacterium]